MWLHFHRRLWQARHTIPPSLRPYFGGATEFKRSTGEADKSRAEVVASGMYAGWRGDLNRAKAALLAGVSPADFMVAPPPLLMLSDLDGPEHFTPTLASIRRREVEQEQKKVLRALAGTRLEDHIDDWLATLRAAKDNTEKTVFMKEADARIFAKKFEYSEEIDRPTVQRWIDEQVAAEAKAATLRRKLSNIRGFWRFLQSRGEVPADQEPLDRLRLPSGKSTSTKVLAFSVAEIVGLANDARRLKDTELVDAIVIGAYTGARIEEIATLEIPHVLLDVMDLVLPGTKTDAAPRRLPIHPDLAPTLRRLIDDRTAGYLFPDLTENKFGDRSNAVGKRFGKIKTAASFGRDKVFHSIRKTWFGQLRNARFEIEMIEQMLGHTTGRLSIDVYALDPARDIKEKAILSLSYPGLL